MRLFKQFVCLSLFSAIGVTPAFAGVLLDFTPITGWDSGQAAQLPPLESGWSAYLMSARSDDNALISAVDVQLRGKFAQRFQLDEESPFGIATPTGLSRSGLDSHLLPADNALLLSSTVHEDLSYESLLPADARVRFGNSLRGVWGIPGNIQRSALDLAYVVIPSGSLDQLDYAIDVATNSGVSNLRKGFAPPVANPAPTQPDYVFKGEVISHSPAPEPYTPPVYNLEVSKTTHLSLTKLNSLNPAANLSITEPGWASYLLSASSTDGAKFSAVDLKLQGNFHQYWGFNEDAGEALATAHGAGRSGVDTHLIPAADAILLSDQFGEDLGPERSVTAGGSAYGVGNSIKGVWGIPGNSQAETLDLAYIVAPEGFSLDQLQYSIDLARSNGGVDYLRNGFALPELKPSAPVDPHSVTGQPQHQTPGTYMPEVTQEDGSIVRVETPIPGWQPGDPWGAVPFIPPPVVEITPPIITRTDLGNGVWQEMRGELLVNYQNGVIIEILQTVLDSSGTAVGATSLFRLGSDTLIPGDPGEPLVGTTQNDHLRGLLNATMKSGATIDLVDYDFLPTDSSGIFTIDTTFDGGHSTSWAEGGASGLVWLQGYTGDSFAYDSDSLYVNMMFSDSNRTFEAVPEPSAILIALVGLTPFLRHHGK